MRAVGTCRAIFSRLSLSLSLSFLLFPLASHRSDTEESGVKSSLWGPEYKRMRVENNNRQRWLHCDLINPHESSRGHRENARPCARCTHQSRVPVTWWAEVDASPEAGAFPFDQIVIKHKFCFRRACAHNFFFQRRQQKTGKRRSSWSAGGRESAQPGASHLARPLPPPLLCRRRHIWID